MDAGNMLKPMLARGELHCIGATTLDEYRKYIEKDAAWSGASSRCWSSSPTVEDTVSILRGLKERFEVHHGVRIQDNALVAAATLSQSLHHRPLPAGQGHRPGRRGLRHHPHRDRLPAAELDEVTRRVMQLEIEEAALKKEKDRPARPGWRRCARSWPTSEGRADTLRAQWEPRKRRSGSCRGCARTDRTGTPGDRGRRAQLRPEPGRRTQAWPSAATGAGALQDAGAKTGANGPARACCAKR
jgi:ATP-dependent Clp protease ATP-binding subunit ClpB